MPTDAELRDMMQATRPPESHAWDRMIASSPSAGEIPRDAWNELYNRFGEARALIEIENPERPFAGLLVINQPRECLDTWQRYIASLS